jgi:hypothetical protein
LYKTSALALDIDNNFSVNFSLFQFETKTSFCKQCWP